LRRYIEIVDLSVVIDVWAQNQLDLLKVQALVRDWLWFEDVEMVEQLIIAGFCKIYCGAI